MKSAKAVVLAAGKGSRLDALNNPKPLVRIGAKTILSRLIRQLEEAGVEDISIVVGHRGDEIVREFLGRSDVSARITYIEQKADESQGGLISSFLSFSETDDRPTIVTMSDLVFAENPFARLLQAAETDKELYSLIGTHGTHRLLCGAQSCVILDNQRIKEVGLDIERPDGVETGIYFMPRGFEPIRSRLHAGYPKDLASLINLLASAGVLGAITWEDDQWYDVNTPAIHTRANMLVRELEGMPDVGQSSGKKETLAEFSSFNRIKNMVSSIYVERGLVKNIGKYNIIPKLKADSPHYLLTDSRVDSFYGDTVLSGFLEAGYSMRKIVVPEGEESKSIDAYNAVADDMFATGIDKHTILFSLGGGVVNNLAGVLASTLYRGIELMHISTSSMSQMDASLDFKQAINSRMGKNLMGSYYPASKILIDPEVLKTLSDRHLRDGISEAIKHALTQSSSFVQYLMEHADRLDDVSVLEHIIKETITLKVPLLRGEVHDDFNEMLPQYGHSVGHAVEHLSAYELYHGEAVAIGICVSAEISKILGFCDESVVETHYDIYRRYQLPTAVPTSIKTEDVIAKIRYDKHYVKGLPHMALPVRIGEMWNYNGVYSVPIEYDVLAKAIEAGRVRS